MGWFSASLAAGWLALGSGLATPTARYDGQQVLRVEPRDAMERALVLELAEEAWSERGGVDFVDVRVIPQQASQLDVTGIPYQVLHENLQTQVEIELDRLGVQPVQPQFGAWFDDFRPLDQVEAYIDELAGVDPELVTVESVGSSIEGRPIRALKIGVPAEGKAAMILTGTMHAREWLSTAVTMCMADQLIRDYGTDDQITELLRTIDVYVVPMQNPDGYAYSWQGERYWRKNRRDGVGVDLNRNWGYEWGGEGASPNPGDENYRGTGPFSEPETQAVSQYMEGLPALVSHIDFHAYAEIIIYPWGYGYAPAPDADTLSMIASNMASAISTVHGRNYQPLQGANFYPAAGAVDDWAYGELGMMSFTIELRGNDFVIAPSQIVPSCEENVAAMLDLGQWSAQFSEVDPAPGETTGASETDGDDAGTSGEPGGTSGPQGSGAGGSSDSSSSDGGGSSGADTVAALPENYGDEEGAACACRTESRTTPAWFLGLFVVLGVGRPRSKRV